MLWGCSTLTAAQKRQACRPPSPATSLRRPVRRTTPAGGSEAPASRRQAAPLGSRPPRAPRSANTSHQCHRKAVAKPPCRRQIPIDRTGRSAEPDPPAVSSPEACRNACRPSAPQPHVSGRRPTTLHISGRSGHRWRRSVDGARAEVDVHVPR